jgi:hypothetical protein
LGRLVTKKARQALQRIKIKVRNTMLVIHGGVIVVSIMVLTKLGMDT